MPVVLNAANEVAVEAFLSGHLSFTGIPTVIERAMAAHRSERDASLPVVREVDRWARAYASSVAERVQLRA